MGASYSMALTTVLSTRVYTSLLLNHLFCIWAGTTISKRLATPPRPLPLVAMVLTREGHKKPLAIRYILGRKIENGAYTPNMLWRKAAESPVFRGLSMDRTSAS